MDLTRGALDASTIIFNHVPKAGGTSLIYLFHEIFGAERCFRHAARDHHSGAVSPPIRKVPRDELNGYRFLAGHFDYGHHALIDRPALYVGVVRDPMDRLLSDYAFNRTQGKEELRELTSRLSFQEYIESKLDNPKSRLVTSAQIRYLTGQARFEAAVPVLEDHFLACCTTDQLDDMQRMLARIYRRPDLPPTRLNITIAMDEHPEISADLAGELERRFADDRRLYDWVAKRFDQVYWSQPILS
ncbi:MAG: sulfotransferase family 2 domain-containing protein [Pseudomonadota bacterium]